MNNRMDEYRELVNELSRMPKGMEGAVERARRRAHRTQFIRKLAAPAATFAATAASFILLINAFPTFAFACSGVPILRGIAAAVAVSPSLSAAVAHDYVHYIGQSQTVDGVTVKLECAIVDQIQAVFFYSVNGGRFHGCANLTDQSGQSISGYGVTSQGGEYEGLERLESMTISLVNCTLPDRFTMEMFFLPDPEQKAGEAPPSGTPAEDWPSKDQDPRYTPGVLCFRFDVTLNPSLISEGRTVDVGCWLELDGQRILVDKLELSPTRTVLRLGEDSGNTAWLKSLKFWFEDEQGNRYDKIDGVVSASGEVDSKSFLTYYFQSLYYNQTQSLTLCVSQAEWLNKNQEHVLLDLTTGECPNLPEGICVDEVRRTGDFVEVRLLAPMEKEGHGQTFAYEYWDPEGNRHEFTQYGCGHRLDDEKRMVGIYEYIYLENYPWDTVELELSFSSISTYEQPIYVPMVPLG